MESGTEKILLKDHPEMFEHEFRRLLMALSLMRSIDLAGLAEACERSHTLGPILHPTMYRGTMEMLSPMAEVAKAAHRAVKAVEQLDAAAQKNRPAAEMIRRLLDAAGA